MTGDHGALHESFARNEDVAGPSERRFGFTFTGVLAFIGLAALSLGRLKRDPHGWL